LGSIFYQFIQNAAGVLLPQRLITQFTGGGVTITDDPPNNRTIVDLSGVAAAECLIFGANGTLTTANDRWLFAGYAQANPRNSNTARMIAPRSGTLRNMYVLHNVVSPDNVNLTYTAEVGGVGTALAVTLLASAVSGSNLVNTVAVAAGQTIGVKLGKAAALTTEADRPVVTMEFA
jgi:hypothetical protein